jgi:asparagine synthase (glutamine-hydrolysing)
MSGLAGIFNLDGRPADVAQLHRMTSAISHRGPDGIRHMIDGPIAIGHCMLCTTPESLHETQPLWDEARMFCLAMHGRVDNREELASALKAAGAILRDDTDAELVLKAYVAWGEDSPRRIVGDFAYIVWNARERSLFCARDHFGMKPLYYYTDGRVFVWASEISQLLLLPMVPKQPNEGMVAEYLADRITSLEETLYAGIACVPPAHCIVVSERAFRKLRYWDIDPSRRIRYRNNLDYVEHLQQILNEAVRCRLRSNAVTGAELSGGLDSSGIVAISQSLIRSGLAQTPGFEAFSMTYPGLPCDESPYFDAVVKMTGVRHNAVPAQTDPAWFAESARTYRDFPDLPNSCMSEPINRLCAAKGIRILLTGLGGDEWRSGRRVDGVCSRLWAACSRSRVLAQLRTSIRPRVALPGWIPDSFARRVSLRDRVAVQPGPRSFSRHQLGVREVLSDGFRIHALGQRERLAAHRGIEYRHPFHDRRLAEFVAAVPPQRLYWDQESKPLLRRALCGLIPPSVLHRRSKAETSAVFSRCFLAHESRLKGLAIARLGWVRQSTVSALCDRNLAAWRSGMKEYLPEIWPLWMVLGTELWYGGNSIGEFV